MNAFWAYEPFHQDPERIKAMHKILGQLAGHPENIKIGFISTHHETELTLAFDIPEEKRFNEYPKSQIKKELKEAKVKFSESNIQVVEHKVHSTTKAVDRMLALASENNSHLIGLFTHARKGYLRLVMGSFAETAIHRSQKDLLILNPKFTTPTKIKHILFASDFSNDSKKEFAKVLQYTKNLKAVLTVFHHAEVIYSWSLAEENSEIKNYKKSVDKMKIWFEQEAREAGVQINVIVRSEFRSTSSLILKLVKKTNVDLIAVCAKSNPVDALIGGSVTRQIARESSVPVLIIKTGVKTTAKD